MRDKRVRQTDARQRVFPPRVLVVDDEPDVRDIVRKVFEAEGWCSVWEGRLAERALGQLSGADLLVSDISMPGMGGLALIRRARREHPDLAILAMSAEPANRPEALAVGADRFLAKPFRIAELQKVAALLLTKSQNDPEGPTAE